MPQLEADFGGRMVGYEFNYALPRIPLCSIPQAGAAGSNPAFRRNTGHFRVDETRSTGCSMAVVNEVPVGRQAVFRAVLGHRRHDDAVGEFQASKLERQKHRWTRSVSTVLSCEPLLVPCDKLRVAELQVLMTDTLATGQQTVGELLWWQ